MTKHSPRNAPLCFPEVPPCVSSSVQRSEEAFTDNAFRVKVSGIVFFEFWILKGRTWEHEPFCFANALRHVI